MEHIVSEMRDIDDKVNAMRSAGPEMYLAMLPMVQRLSEEHPARIAYHAAATPVNGADGIAALRLLVATMANQTAGEMHDTLVASSRILDELTVALDAYTGLARSVDTLHPGALG